MGVGAWAATTETELEKALIAVAQTPGPALIDVAIDPSTYDHVLQAIRG